VVSPVQSRAVQKGFRIYTNTICPLDKVGNCGIMGVERKYMDEVNDVAHGPVDRLPDGWRFEARDGCYRGYGLLVSGVAVCGGRSVPCVKYVYWDDGWCEVYSLITGL